MGASRPACRTPWPRSSRARRARASHREQQGLRAPEEGRLLRVADLTEEFNERIVQQRHDDLIEVLLVGRIDLRRDLQGQSGAVGNLDREIGPLLGADAATERQITPRSRVEGGISPLRLSKFDGNELA